ncbi:hypothetical protein ACOMHN_014290 [Nucella lapillus]
MALLSVVMCTICVVTQVTALGNTLAPDYVTSQDSMTASDRAMKAALNLMTHHSSSFGFTSAVNQTTSRPPEVHRLGIIPSIADEKTTHILEMLENERVIFERVSMTTPMNNNLDSFRAALKEVRSQGVTAVIGPFHTEYSVACQHLRVPYLVTSQLPILEQSNAFVIELFPDHRVFSQAVLDMLRYYNFKKAAIIYDSPAGAAVLEKMLAQPDMQVTGFRVQSHNVSNVRQALKSMREQYFVSYLSIVSADVTGDVMDQALSLSMFSTPTYKWLLVNTGLEEFSLEKYVDSRANITVLRLMMDYDSRSCALQPDVITLKRAILHDAISVYVTYVSERANMSHFSMRRANRQLDVDGCTGHLQFTRFGRRKESYLQLMTLQGYRSGKVSTN